MKNMSDKIHIAEIVCCNRALHNEELIKIIESEWMSGTGPVCCVCGKTHVSGRRDPVTLKVTCTDCKPLGDILW